MARLLTRDEAARFIGYSPYKRIDQPFVLLYVLELAGSGERRFQVDTVWLNGNEAGALVGKSKQTVRRWARVGWVKTRVRTKSGLKEYDRESLLEAAAKSKQNKSGCAGPGRGHVGVPVRKPLPNRHEDRLPSVVLDDRIKLETDAQLREYIERRVTVVNNCWEWPHINKVLGYGGMGINGRRMLAHRVSWAAFNEAEIPEGMQIDHRCRNRSCVNPAHLDLVTHQVNCSRRKRMPVLDPNLDSNARYFLCKELGLLEPQDGFDVADGGTGNKAGISK